MKFSVEFYQTVEQGPGNSGPRYRKRDSTNARLAEENKTMKKTNFDLYLEEQLKDPVFAARFKQAGEAWDVALQIAALREQAGLSQRDLAKLLKTSQQQISRLESPEYEGHSLGTLRRVAEALHTKVRVVFEPQARRKGTRVAEERTPYGTRRSRTRRK